MREASVFRIHKHFWTDKWMQLLQYIVIFTRQIAFSVSTPCWFAGMNKPKRRWDSSLEKGRSSRKVAFYKGVSQLFTLDIYYSFIQTFIYYYLFIPCESSTGDAAVCDDSRQGKHRRICILPIPAQFRSLVRGDRCVEEKSNQAIKYRRWSF